ncbi:hypothetical protein FGU71_11575 [Erythrobacter insulae]|uniref:Zinc ribbon domain-containing protein n=1 Tax=Erythrobacter insulae TaxID=2584124 RepID=A0A547PE96_9SPHN|nr:hypothetical protein [Erythrobacter insulae]TRD12439.1 hypothetical protein FGU71_11575 [Erythrobacter insulae]
MNTYQAAKQHALRMLGALFLAILFVIVVERFWGHSSIAFAIAIVGLVAMNTPMLRLNCKTCGKNLFFRGIFVVPWPNRICGKCGTDLTQANP